jgi:hypothetical protein
MKVKQIPAFRKWLNAMCALDKRIKAEDFNKLFRLYRRSAK